jgi:hypothetical protein
MNDVRYACAICGQESSAPHNWFLVTERRWDDKLQILQWDERLAGRARAHSACSTGHVQELVVHWMATGRLDHPLARVTSWDGRVLRWLDMSGDEQDIDTADFKILGELSVHRDSLQRVLSENPHSLRTILGQLQAALEPQMPVEPENAKGPVDAARIPTWEV